jgi:hypothetical protein
MEAAMVTRVKAVGVSSHSGTKGVSAAIERAMSSAVLRARKQGITDSAITSKMMMEARAKVKAEFEERAKAQARRDAGGKAD